VSDVITGAGALAAQAGALVALAIALLIIAVALRRDVSGGLERRVQQLETRLTAETARRVQLEAAMVAAGLPVPPWPDTITQESAA
jgi:hypothetical protein